MKIRLPRLPSFFPLIIFVTCAFSFSVAQVSKKSFPLPVAKFTKAVAFDVSPPVRNLPLSMQSPFPSGEREIRPEPGVTAVDHGFSGDGAVQRSFAGIGTSGANIPSPLVSFEGFSNQDNFTIYGGRVNPPDPNGAVGPNHFVEMINLVFGVFDKQGNLLSGPTAIGDLFTGFAISDCTDPSGDPIVLYDHLTDHWLLSQFTTRGPIYYNCVAISQTGDPTGAYFRYAFLAGPFFPDYPKYGNWPHTYILTSRDFGNDGSYGISVYGLERDKMVLGDPNARSVHFFLDSAQIPIYLMGDGLLPADLDGSALPTSKVAAPVVGTMDDGAFYGAPSDALNIWELSVQWKATPVASINLVAQLPVAAFDSIFPCAPTSRDCLPQPGITDPNQYLDILSYRQRPTFRLAFRKFGTTYSMVTNQSVEAAPAIAGVRWYEIHKDANGYSLFQQGTFAPDDGVHRWMGSIAQDHVGNAALGYSVVNGTDVFPGIRYTGRLKNDPLGEMTLGEGTIIDGSGVQRTTNSRWGDYTSMAVDPTDDCTFWYTNEYYTLAGQLSSSAGWQTRIASFQLPGCVQ